MINHVILTGGWVCTEIKQEELQIGGKSVPSVKFRVRLPINGGSYRYFNVRALGKTAVFICDSFSKGSPIEIEGVLDSYVKEADGIKTEYVTINAQRASGNEKGQDGKANPTKQAVPSLPADFKPGAAAGGSFNRTSQQYSGSHPEGIQFAMYHTDQYTALDGEFSTVKAADGSKWYRQYAANIVERSNPHRNEEEKIVYDEKIVKKLPKAPQRKDRV